MHPPSLDRLTKPARADINRPVDVHGNTYLHALCRSGAPLALVAEAVRVLGADVNMRNSNGYSPLRYAVEYGNAETAAYLLKHGAQARYNTSNSAAAQPYNAVIAAVYRGNREMMDAVLNNGAARHVNDSGIDNRDNLEKTPVLNLAVQKYQYDLLPALVAAGADMRRTAPDTGFTAIMQAVNNDAAGVIHTLVRLGADINARGGAGTSHAGQTALHLAAQSDHRNTVTDMLIRLGADLELRDAKGRTPLMIAVEAGNRRMTEILLKAGANPDARNAQENNETALMIAARKGNSDGAALLLAHKADPLLADKFNRTAAKIASDNPSSSRSLYDPMMGFSAPQPKTMLAEAEQKAAAKRFEDQYRAQQRGKKNGNHKP